MVLHQASTDPPPGSSPRPCAPRDVAVKHGQSVQEHDLSRRPDLPREDRRESAVLSTCRPQCNPCRSNTRKESRALTPCVAQRNQSLPNRDFALPSCFARDHARARHFQGHAHDAAGVQSSDCIPREGLRVAQNYRTTELQNYMTAHSCAAVVKCGVRPSSIAAR